MANKFPSYLLSRAPIFNEERADELYGEPVIYSPMESGNILTRKRYTNQLWIIPFTYYCNDKDIEILKSHYVQYCGSEFEFEHPITGTIYYVKYLPSEKPRFVQIKKNLWYVTLKFVIGYSISSLPELEDKMRLEYCDIEDLAPGAEIIQRPFFIFPGYEVTIQELGILTEDNAIGVDNNNKVTIIIEKSGGFVLVEKVYDLANQPPAKSYGNLGNLNNNNLSIGDILFISLICGTNANMPAFKLATVYN